MRTIGEIYDKLDEFAPFHTAMSYDNPGLLVGSRGTEINTLLLSLDITPEVIAEAVELGAELILSHHPVIFNPLKRLEETDAPYLLAHHGIGAICAHTNLDLAQGGVNTCLAERLSLTRLRPVKLYGEAALAEGLIGDLDREYEPAEFAAYVKNALDCGGLKYTRGGRKIKTVGLCGGAGADLLFDAASKGVDAFVSADTKHHELLAACQMGITLVDAGHFCTEDVVIQPLMKRLKAWFPELKLQKSIRMCDPVCYL